ncbi:MAG: MFS transporter [Nitrospinota bacterium]|nr:MFS transporter [Nitrospinota bacterium]
MFKKFIFSVDAEEESYRYYGWMIVGLSFSTMAIAGSIVATFPVFYVAFLEEFHWSRADAAFGFSVSMITFALSAGLIGAMVDRWGPRIVVPSGICVLCLSLVLMTGIDSLPKLYFFYGVLVALGITLIGFIPTSTVISSWFVKRRSTAMGIALSGRSFGSVIMVPFAAFLIGLYGWRSAYLILAGIIFFFVFPINLIFHRSSRKVNIKDVSREESIDWTLRKAFKEPVFWLFCLAGIFHGIGFSIVGVHQVAHMVDVGIDTLTAASLIGALALIRSIGGIFGGWMGDRVGLVSSYILFGTLGLIGVVLLMNFSGENIKLPYFYVLFYGLGEGARSIMFVSLKARIFPGKSFGRILGFSQMGSGFASATGPWLAGYIFDVSGTYFFAFSLVLIFKVLSICTVTSCAVLAKKKIFST